ncbi:hypothetical protein HED51_05300 [Ochrobactrum grignonense]|nr:hypothetical protein [Brucella grignonensis]
MTSYDKDKIKNFDENAFREELIGRSINDYEAWKDVYKLSIELRNFEINQLVQRNNFL